MVVIVFTNRLRADADLQAYEQHGNEMYALAQQNPGFVSINEYSSEDGEHVTIVQFTTLEALEHWRTQPDHVRMQQMGRERFYDSYTIQVCNTVRQYAFDAKEGRRVIQ
jgi:antibiotic biosynthesis monooxygenase (ABM) superfamily enzyme